MAVVYKKSELGTFLEQLPNLVMNYQAQIADREREERLADKRFDQEVQLMEMKNEKDEAINAQKLLIDKYDRKQVQLKEVLNLFDDFPGLKAEDMTSGAPKLTDDYVKSGKIDLEMLSQDISSISGYIGELEDAKLELDSQVQEFTKLAPEFHGLNTVLQAQEFAELKEHAVTELGYQPEAMDYAYGQMGSPTQIKESAYKMTDYLKKEHTQAGAGNYALLQGVIDLEKGQDMDDLIEKLSYEDKDGDIVEPSEAIVKKAVEFLGQVDHKYFMENLHAYPGESGDKLREFFTTNPKFRTNYSNLKDSYRNEVALEREMLDIFDEKSDVDITQFSSDISGMDKQSMFGHYKSIISKVPLGEHQDYFKAMEKEAKSGDLYPEYLEYTGTGDLEDKPEEGSLEELVGFTKEMEVLTNLEKTQEEKYEEYRGEIHDMVTKWVSPGFIGADTPLSNTITSILNERMGRDDSRIYFMDSARFQEGIQEGVFDFSADEMSLIRNTMRNEAAKYMSAGAERDALGYIADKWTGTKRRPDALKLLTDYIEFEKAWSSHMGTKDLPIDQSKALLELEELLKKL
jgi:hypothetical protein